MNASDLSQLPLPYDELKGRKIAILGSTGLIASTLVEKLCGLDDALGLGLELIVTYRNKSKAERRFSELRTGCAIEYLRYDVTEPFPDVDVDFIVHSASPAHPKAFVENPVGVMKANIDGVTNVLEHARAHPETRVLYVSSGEVYGAKTENRPYAETDTGLLDPLNFRACYPESKRAAETLCRCYQHQYGVDSVIVRPGHVYGPALMSESTRVDVQFMRNALAGEDILMKSLGLQRRSYIHVDDVVSGMLFAMLKGGSGEAYNISNRHSDVTIREYAEILAGIAGVSVRMEVDAASCAGSSQVQDSTLDSSKLEDLGWVPRIRMEEGLKETFDALRSRDRAL